MKENVYTYSYPHPAVTVDCVIFGYDGKHLKVLLIERRHEPYRGCWALPGGFMEIEETAGECARRELAEETGLTDVFMEQFYTFTTVRRDPRERVISIAHYALVPISEVKAGDDARRAAWFLFDELPRMAFDHMRIFHKALAVLKEKIYFEPIGFELMPEEFTMTQLRRLYETILNRKFDRRNFANKIIKLGLVSETAPREPGTPTRVPIKYRFNADRYTRLKRSGFNLEF